VRLTENLAPVLAESSVRINAVAPGFVATRMQDAVLAAGPNRAGASYHEKTSRQVAEGGTPPEAAAALTGFLLSADASGITGRLISAQWDNWRDPEVRGRLTEPGNFATLRRVDEVMVKSVPR
jgi:3-oxoacyl-[acyl-carrier protein] reductase